MAAQRKARDEAILRAILEWGGVVSAAATALNIHRNTLKEHLDRLGVDAAGIRKGCTSPPGMHCTASHCPVHTARNALIALVGGADGAKVSDGAAFSGAPGSPTLDVMSTAEAVQTRPGRMPRAPRFKADRLQRLAQVRRELSARLGRDLTNDDVNDLFYAEHFEEFATRHGVGNGNGDTGNGNGSGE